MRAVIQRVSSASVVVGGQQSGAIGRGIVTLLGIHRDDSDREAAWLAEKIVNLRIFPDAGGAMNRSLADIEAEMLIVSQFTLYGDCRKGRRPGFSEAAPPELAEPLYRRFIAETNRRGIPTAHGVFQTMMEVTLVNDGPVTLLVDSSRQF